MAADESAILRLVHKKNYDEQFFFNTSIQKLPPLSASSVRVRTNLIGLTSNNLGYCAFGTLLHWWDTFPVPAWTEAPYNNPSEYGISAAWGFGTILESSIPALPPGSLLWGFLPISTLPVDLSLTSSGQIDTHFIENSPHRQRLMSFYQRYISYPQLDGFLGQLSSAWKANLLPMFECGWAYNRFNFASIKDMPIIPPSKTQEWSPSNADLGSAVLICLAAGGKTCRSFVHQLVHARAPGSGPLALLEVSSSSQSSPLAQVQGGLPFEHKTVTYQDLEGDKTLKWLTERHVQKYVVIDFGARDGMGENFVVDFRGKAGGTPVNLLSVGAESKIYTGEELERLFQGRTALGAWNIHASDIREGAIAKLGATRYFSDLTAEFDRLVTSAEDDKLLGATLHVKQGLRGEDGLERWWNEMAEGQVYGDQALSFLL